MCHVTTLPAMNSRFDFEHAPGHLIRRAHQVAYAVFMAETAGFEVTPVQFAILIALIDTPGMDQITLAGRVALDAATSGSVIARLESKGWVRRAADPSDRRRKQLWATEAGVLVAGQMKAAVVRAQQRILKPLPRADQARFLALLEQLVAGHAGSADL